MDGRFEDARTTQRRRIGRVHMIGIGGAGMSGIAEVLVTLGYEVSGSDQSDSATVARLRELGADVNVGHAAEHVDGAEVVVVSSAINSDNAEIQAARARRLPIVKRAEMLGELMRFRNGIAVAGTHGKTTTTSLVTSIFEAAGLDPTFVIGGVLTTARTGARLGQSSWFVAEADESDASFLHLQPLLAVVTNIDCDHLETYAGSVERLKDTFVDFCQRLPFYGRLVACIDDAGVREVLPRITRPVITYGLAENADYRAVNLATSGRGSRFSVLRAGKTPIDVELNLPGRHNVLNALAAVAVTLDAGVDEDAVVHGLSACRGVGRRFEIHDHALIAGRRVTLVDDYGHHPTEIEAVIATARELWGNARLVMVFQPHRYTRTRDLLSEFGSVLRSVDLLLLVDVYSAGEQPIAGADAEAIRQTVQSVKPDPVEVFAKCSDVIDVLPRVLEDGDVLITQGAGDIGALSRQLQGAA